MPARLILVSDLVERCSPPSEEHRALWLRRARQWSDAEILPTAKRQREGTGRHRLYNFETIYMAAVLFRLADLGLPIGIIAAVASLIRPPHRSDRRRKFAEFWSQAKTSEGAGFDCYLAVAPDPRQKDTAVYDMGVGSIELPDGAWAVLNLSKTFSLLKL